MLNIGASPQQVLAAQQFAAGEAANRVAAQAELLHQASMSEVQGQVRDVLSEAGSAVDQLREQLRASEVRCHELFEYGQFMERQLTEAKAELSRIESELSSQVLSFQRVSAALQECQSSNNTLTFQLNQTRVENQIKDREIQRLRSAAPSASNSGSPPKPPKSSAQPTGSVPGSSEASWVHLEGSDPPLEQKAYPSAFDPPLMSSCPIPSHPTSSMSDPRVDQLIEIVQQLVQQVGQNATDHDEATDDHDVDGGEEVVKELREKDIVDQRALLHLKLEPVPSDAASFRSWKNGFKVQLSKLDTSGQGLVLAWISRGFDADKADLQDSELLPRLDAWVAGELSSGRVLKQSSELEQDITAYIERCGQLGHSPKGRVMLSIISRHYDLDRVRGSVLTASTLFQIELGGNSI